MWSAALCDRCPPDERAQHPQRARVSQVLEVNVTERTCLEGGRGVAAGVAAVVEELGEGREHPLQSACDGTGRSGNVLVEVQDPAWSQYAVCFPERQRGVRDAAENRCAHHSVDGDVVERDGLGRPGEDPRLRTTGGGPSQLA